LLGVNTQQFFPQSKIEQLKPYLASEFEWAAQGCLELVACRNVLTHSSGYWNAKTIAIVRHFVVPIPKEGDKLIVGMPMLFRYRKAIRTFLNEVGTQRGSP
jgi:hypothetical protein